LPIGSRPYADTSRAVTSSTTLRCAITLRMVVHR
jgi:hypothetical protein